MRVWAPLSSSLFKAGITLHTVCAPRERIRNACARAQPDLLNRHQPSCQQPGAPVPVEGIRISAHGRAVALGLTPSVPDRDPVPQPHQLYH